MKKQSLKYLLYLICFGFVINIAEAQIPPGYYDDAIGLTGDELKDALHDIIKDHDPPSYNDLRDFILKESDEDPNNPDNVILLYTGISRDKDMFGGDPPNEWNREHVWAKSHGNFGNSPPEGTDAHHIRPSDVQINSIRGNLDFDMGGDPVSGAPGCKKDNDSFEPRDQVKGDVARMIFYMDVRYDGGNGELNLIVVDEVNTAPAPEHGKLSTLLEWHQQDPPDDFERNRNDVVYSYQENRNPFIDHPEFVEEIWGDPSSIHITEQVFIRCYPNPAIDNLYIEYQNNVTLTYSLLSIDGKQILEGQMQAEKSTIDISIIGNGLFLLLIKDENSNVIKQFKVLKTTH